MSGHAGAGHEQAEPLKQAGDDAEPQGVLDAASGATHPAAKPDGKDPAAFRTIGEVARALTIAPHVLRYWEEQFPMLHPVKRSGGRRYYRPEDIALVEEIHRLVHRQGYTLRGARHYLEGRQRPSGQKAPVPPAAALLEGLIALRQELADLLNKPD